MRVCTVKKCYLINYTDSWTANMHSASSAWGSNPQLRLWNTGFWMVNQLYQIVYPWLFLFGIANK